MATITQNSLRLVHFLTIGGDDVLININNIDAMYDYKIVVNQKEYNVKHTLQQMIEILQNRGED